MCVWQCIMCSVSAPVFSNYGFDIADPVNIEEDSLDGGD
jgi:hypothetical protein